MEYCIDNFWMPHFEGKLLPSIKTNIRGWSTNLDKNPYFV
jgi:hypothetical protein